MDATLIKFLRLALAVISDRLITLCGLFMSFGLACWTMIEPTVERLGMAAFFAGFAFLLVVKKDRKLNETQD